MHLISDISVLLQQYKKDTPESFCLHLCSKIIMRSIPLVHQFALSLTIYAHTILFQSLLANTHPHTHTYRLRRKGGDKGEKLAVIYAWRKLLLKIQVACNYH